MTSGAPWSVKGIDPKAREIAKDLAHRSGMTLGEWLNQMIFDDGAKPDPVEGAMPRVAALARPAAESRLPRRDDDLDRVLVSLETLSTRLDASERQQARISARFEAALTDLRADQARVAERLQTAVGGTGRAETLRALDVALGQLGRHMQEGEGRSREALVELRKEIGEEVERIADRLNRKVEEVENRGADAISQVGAEVTRVAAVVEQRLRRADDAQAEALEKLGAEIARITERLSERIAAAERRSAQAIDDVGEQMARVTDRIHQRQERTISEIGDRMRQSEERTAKLLEDAREKIERRLARPDEPETVAERIGVQEAAAQKPAAPRWGASLGVPPPTTSRAISATSEPVFIAPPVLLPPAETASADLEQAAPPGPAIENEETAGLEPVIEHDPPVEEESVIAAAAHDMSDASAPREPMTTAAEMLADEPASHSEDPDVEDGKPAPQSDSSDPMDVEAAAPIEPGATAQEGLRPSTRELIAAARAAARTNSENPGYHPSGLADAGEADALFGGAGQRRARMSGALRGVLVTGGAAVSIGLAASGYVMMHPEIMSSFNRRAPVKTNGAQKPIPVGPASAPSPPIQSSPQSQAMSLTSEAPKPALVADEPDAAALFREASTKVDMGDASGVAPLRSAANLGYAPAQRRLGKLYEDGGAGVQKDEVEGRRWTQRAAANGDARGMHNLGLDYYEGAGGVKSMAVAAQWFQRAAELGLRDSQYNLARFYESGLGVKQDLAAAYKWYLIAGRAGDTEAASRGEAIKPQLSADVRAEVEKAATNFRPDPAAAPNSMVAGLKSATPKQLALAQRALSKLGYYQGASDGAPSQSLGEAIQAYQRDRGLAANGSLSPGLVQTFANVSR